MTYLNPVYDHSCPDPFVLKYRGEYWAYSTGIQPDGRWFGVARSRDLVQWETMGSAMEPLPGNATCLWAPEITYDNGRFYMFYSYGDEVHMQIRVAIAEHPAGPFTDSGRTLTDEQFAIDAHVFADDDGTRFLFYATDYLDYSHIGTGTARRRMRDLLSLEGPAEPVVRARYDWQVYDPNRAERGGVRWHTVEGSFVLKHKGRYYHMFSGGNWQNISYGVSYATADRIDAPGEWQQHADGETILPILRTIPGEVIGPGHNSVVRGPDNRQLFCAYHRWNTASHERVLAIDPLDWAGERMLVLGPSTTPQPGPNRATFAEWFDMAHDEGLGPDWTCTGGHWRAQDGEAQQRAAHGLALARCAVAPPCFGAEATVRALPGNTGCYGFSIGDELRLLIDPAAGRMLARAMHDGTWNEPSVPLHDSFVPEANHLLQVERNGRRVSLALDSITRLHVELPDEAAAPLALCTEDGMAAFAGFAITEGWEDLFTESDTPAALGWQAAGDGWRIEHGQLTADTPAAPLIKAPVPAAYELVVNVRLLHADAGAGWAIVPDADAGGRGTALALVRDGGGWALQCQTTAGEQRLPLPKSFDPLIFQQFRVRVNGGTLIVGWETHLLGELAAKQAAHGVAVYGQRAAFDAVRVIVLQ